MARLLRRANEHMQKDSGYRRNLRQNSHNSGQDIILIVEWSRMVNDVVLEKMGGMWMDSHNAR